MPVPYLSEEKFDHLLKKLKEFQDETEITILKFSFEMLITPRGSIPLKHTHSFEVNF